MFRLAHLSDLHLGPLPEPSYGDLASKRITGYINWQRHRGRHIGSETLARICDDINAHDPDHIALTGDLINLALDAEIDLARQWLENFGDPRDVSVVPGNHDAYVPGAIDKACRAWAPWMTGDGANSPVDSRAFPYLRVRGPAALIGISTARATAPFLATGFFRQEQAAALKNLLERTGAQGLFRVVMIHHPPVRGATTAHKKLNGIRLFQKTVAEAGAELVLHGHTHLPTLYRIPGQGEETVPVVGVAAAGQGAGGRKPPACYNLFEIEGAAGAWDVTMIRRGLTGAAMPVDELERVVLSE